MTSGTDTHDLASMTATANQLADMMDTATRLMEALAPAMSRLGRMQAALDRLNGSLQDIPATRAWTAPAPGMAPSHHQQAAHGPVPLAVARNSYDTSTRSTAQGLSSATLVFLLDGSSQSVDLERIYQTLAAIPGVEEVIPGAYSRDRAAFDLRTSRPANELALQEALTSAIPGVSSGEWTSSGEFVVAVGGTAGDASDASMTPTSSVA
jgi:hypothetical protein